MARVFVFVDEPLDTLKIVELRWPHSGVPEIIPVEESNVNPSGSGQPILDQVQLPEQPMACNVAV